MNDQFDQNDHPHDCPLTPHELHVLRIFIECGTEPAAAEVLYLSPHTVDRHMKNIKEKLGLHHNVQVAALAGKKGWL